MTERDATQPARMRRAPRIGAFIGVGAILGILVTVVVTTSFPADPSVGMWATVAYMSIYGVTAGIVLGAVVVLIADRISRKHARAVTVERGKVTSDAPESTAEPAPAASSGPQPEPSADVADRA